MISKLYLSLSKVVCNSCGTINSNTYKSDYAYNRNIFWLYNCAEEFKHDLEDIVLYKYIDNDYHEKSIKSGKYCMFCFGTNYENISELEDHNIERNIVTQSAEHRFLIQEMCRECNYENINYISAKSVVSNYYGEVDGNPHTINITDLSEEGVTVQVKYGESADSCDLELPPSYDEKGDYAVYYEIIYTYEGADITENGVAYVNLKEREDGSGYDCDGDDKHVWDSTVIREASCRCSGLTVESCTRCGKTKLEETPKGEHQYEVESIEPTCVNIGYTVKQCAACDDRHVTDITETLEHNYKAVITSATCETGGHTSYLCFDCGNSYISDYKDALGHKFDEGTEIADSSCLGGKTVEYKCLRCNYRKIEGGGQEGHNPGYEATCTDPQICNSCGIVVKNALGHKYNKQNIAATCEKKGYTAFICVRCGDSYNSNYTDTVGHKSSEWIIDRAASADKEGSMHIECLNCRKILRTNKIAKLDISSETDQKGEATVGRYVVIVSDMNTGSFIQGAFVNIDKNGNILIELPKNRIIDYDNKTVVTVLEAKDRKPAEKIFVSVYDKYENYCKGITDEKGKIIVPGSSSETGSKGNATAGCENSSEERFTITVKVVNYNDEKIVEGAKVSIINSDNIVVDLPDGMVLDEKNRVMVTVSDNYGKPKADVDVTVKNYLDIKVFGITDINGEVIVPVTENISNHNAYIYGYPNGTIKPEGNMTRAEAAAVFARQLAEKKEDRNFNLQDSGFSDVSAEWYAGYIKYLKNYGIIEGYRNGTFAPDSLITRGEFTAMAVRFFDIYSNEKIKSDSEYRIFSVTEDDYWASEYINDAAKHGWIKGYEDGTFKEKSNITRAEVVTIINRMLKRSADEGYIDSRLDKFNRFSDLQNRDYWAFYQLMEAANNHYTDMSDGESWIN
ncbi:MAG: S-layer homology domain-containing protein [Firmicutes bacterium]|nr:S-layer homology domain-containing protein [Bacillota bacterium]